MTESTCQQCGYTWVPGIGHLTVRHAGEPFCSVACAVAYIEAHRVDAA
jgi:ribosomal protein L24E